MTDKDRALPPVEDRATHEPSRAVSALRVGVPSAATIYHGTPMTPRAALRDVLAGRAACVSFYRPDSLEDVLAVCPQLMFRSRRVLDLDGGDACRRGPRGSGKAGVVRLLRLARSHDLGARPLGDYTGHSSSAFPTQRWAAQRQPVRPIKNVAGIPHGRPDCAARQALRAIRSCMSRLDRRPETGAGRLRCVPPPNGRGCRADGQHLASDAHATRHPGGARLSFCWRGRHLTRTEWMAL